MIVYFMENPGEKWMKDGVPLRPWGFSMKTWGTWIAKHVKTWGRCPDWDWSFETWGRSPEQDLRFNLKWQFNYQNLSKICRDFTANLVCEASPHFLKTVIPCQISQMSNVKH